MSAMASSQGSQKNRIAAAQLSGRLAKCWSFDVNWDLYPEAIREVKILEIDYCLTHSLMLSCNYMI